MSKKPPLPLGHTVKAKAPNKEKDHEHYEGESAMNLKHWMNVNVLVSKYQGLIHKKSYNTLTQLHF